MNKCQRSPGLNSKVNNGLLCLVMIITQSKNMAARKMRMKASANEPNSGDAILINENDKPQTAAKMIK